jgi:putative intracellular protease/amidase
MGEHCCGMTRRNYLTGSAGAMLAATGLGSTALIADTAKGEPVSGAETYRCPPCGQPCDQLVFDKPGSCPVCGMTLVAANGEGVTKVGVLLFNGVEIIDFAGPWEIFGSAGFAMHTVSSSIEPVTTVFGQKLVPDHSFETSPKADVLLVPGGAVFRCLKDGRTIPWLRAKARDVDYVMSVCTGAYLLQGAGLLAGKTVTATSGMIEDFASPDTRVVYDRRFVDNGKIITTAGLSAGIDGALHLVSKMLGSGVAQSVALSMEYHWEPDGKWARADLADRYLPDALNSCRGGIGGAKMALLSTAGTSDEWETRTLFTEPKTSGEVIGVLRKLVAANRAAGGILKPTSHIPEPPAFAAGSSDSELRWSFTDDQGRRWKGTAAVAPDGQPGRGLVSTVKLARAD